MTARGRAGVKAGDELRVESGGAGRIMLIRVENTIVTSSGRLTGVYPKGSLQKLRREWR